MKHVFLKTTALLFFCLLCITCKKGEDDPAFTVLSRKARMTGEWKMKSAKVTFGYKDATRGSSTIMYVFSENNYTRDVVGGAHFEGPASLELLITKKGDISIKQKVDTVSMETRGTWDFMGKVGKSKNKEYINIKLSTTDGNTNWYHMINKGNMNFNYRIKELRNKKLVLVCEEEMMELTSQAGIYVTAEYTFEQ